MPNTIDELRTQLFDTLKQLRDPDKPMEIDRARAIADVAKVIVDSAKVEVDFARVTGGAAASGFLPVVTGDRRGGPALPAARDVDGAKKKLLAEAFCAPGEYPIDRLARCVPAASSVVLDQALDELVSEGLIVRRLGPERRYASRPAA